MVYANPTLIYHFAKDTELEKCDLETLKSIVTSGAPIGEATMQLCRRHLKLQDLRQGSVFVNKKLSLHSSKLALT